MLSINVMIIYIILHIKMWNVTHFTFTFILSYNLKINLDIQFVTSESTSNATLVKWQMLIHIHVG